MMPAASPSDMTVPKTPGAEMLAAPAVMPMESPGAQMPAAPATPMYMMSAPVDSPGTQTGPQMFSAGFFAGLASNFAIGFIIMAKRIYDDKKKSGESLDEDALELGIMTASASRKVAVANVARTQGVSMQFGKKPAKKVAKKPIKKVVKKPIKKVVKKPIKKAVKKPIKKAVKKPVKKPFQKPNKNASTGRNEIGFIASFAGESVNNFG